MTPKQIERLNDRLEAAAVAERLKHAVKRANDATARIAQLETELAEAKNGLMVSEQYRRAYAAGKFALYSMGGEITEAACKHLPCSEGPLGRYTDQIEREHSPRLVQERAELIRQLEAREAELAEARKSDIPENDGTSFAHPAWWRGQEAGDRYRLAAVVTELSLLLGVEIATDDLPKQWDELKQLVAEARKERERLDKLESYPYAMEIKAITKYHKSDSVPSLRAQIDHFIATEIDAAGGPQ